MQPSVDPATAFDAAANGYDRDFTHSPAGNLQRKRVWHYLRPVLKRISGQDVLELNCGTGEDALLFARLGFRVQACDISPLMVETARQKAAAASINPSPVFRVASFAGTGAAFGNQKFHLAFSDFGGINCIPPEEVKLLAQQLKDMLHPLSECVFVVMGKNCIFENLFFALTKNKAQLGRRKSGGPLMAKVGERAIPVWYYSPRRFRKLFSEYFYPVSTRPVGLLIPPGCMQGWFASHPLLLKIMYSAEKVFSLLPGMALYSDHYFIRLKLRESSALYKNSTV